VIGSKSSLLLATEITCSSLLFTPPSISPAGGLAPRHQLCSRGHDIPMQPSRAPPVTWQGAAAEVSFSVCLTSWPFPPLGLTQKHVFMALSLHSSPFFHSTNNLATFFLSSSLLLPLSVSCGLCGRLLLIYSPLLPSWGRYLFTGEGKLL
jgi:hypothetical protein